MDFTDCSKQVIYLIFSFFLTILGTLVALVAIFVSLFRIWFVLIKAFIYVLLDVILAPFWIFLGLLPGSQISFNAWVRHIIAHLAVFPATALLLTLANILARTSDTPDPGQIFFVPPLIGNPNIGNNINLLIAFGFILLTPELLNMVRDALKVSGSKYAGSINAGVGVGVGVPVSSLKGTGGTIMSSREAIVNKGGGYDDRGLFKALAGKALH